MSNGSESVDDLIRRIERLRIQEATLLRRLVAAREAERAVNPQEPERTGIARFRVGDRVRITNEIRNPFGRRITAADRVGVVYRITEQRVHIRTDTNNTYQRAPRNVQHE